MAWTAPRTWVTGEIVTAALMNTHVRDNLRYLKGLDGTAQIQDGLDLIGTGTLSRLRPPLLTQAQKDALSGAAQGWVIYNSGKNTPEWYGTAWEEEPTVPGTSVQGDIIYRSGSAWERLAAGISGRWLQTKGATANPEWVASPGIAIFVWGVSSALTGIATRFILLNSDAALQSTEANAQILIPRAGTLKNLYIRVTASNSSYVVTVRLNGADTALTISKASGQTGTFSDTANTVTVAAGDLLSISFLVDQAFSVTIDQISVELA